MGFEDFIKSIQESVNEGNSKFYKDFFLGDADYFVLIKPGTYEIRNYTGREWVKTGKKVTLTKPEVGVFVDHGDGRYDVQISYSKSMGNTEIGNLHPIVKKTDFSRIKTKEVKRQVEMYCGNCSYTEEFLEEEIPGRCPNCDASSQWKENASSEVDESKIDEHNGPVEGDKVSLKSDWTARGNEKSDRKGKVGTFVKLTSDSRSEGGNSRGDTAIIKWEDGKTTNEVYYGLIKVK